MLASRVVIIFVAAGLAIFETAGLADSGDWGAMAPGYSAAATTLKSGKKHQPVVQILDGDVVVGSINLVVTAD